MPRGREPQGFCCRPRAQEWRWYPDNDATKAGFPRCWVSRASSCAMSSVSTWRHWPRTAGWTPGAPCVSPRPSCFAAAADAGRAVRTHTRKSSFRRRGSPCCSLCRGCGCRPSRGSDGRGSPPAPCSQTWRGNLRARRQSQGRGHWWARRATGCRGCRKGPWPAARALSRYPRGRASAYGGGPPWCRVRSAGRPRRSRRSSPRARRNAPQALRRGCRLRLRNLALRKGRLFPTWCPKGRCVPAARCSWPCSRQTWSGPAQARSYAHQGPSTPSRGSARAGPRGFS